MLKRKGVFLDFQRGFFMPLWCKNAGTIFQMLVWCFPINKINTMRPKAFLTCLLIDNFKLCIVEHTVCKIEASVLYETLLMNYVTQMTHSISFIPRGIKEIHSYTQPWACVRNWWCRLKAYCKCKLVKNLFLLI